MLFLTLIRYIFAEKFQKTRKKQKKIPFFSKFRRNITATISENSGITSFSNTQTYLINKKTFINHEIIKINHIHNNQNITKHVDYIYYFTKKLFKFWHLTVRF